MSETQQKRKSPVKSIIQHEEYHFKYEAARLIRDLYRQKKRPVPQSIHDHYSTLDDLFKKHKPIGRETTYIRLGKRWIKDLLDSSPEFGKNTALIQKVRAEATRCNLDRHKHQQTAQTLFHTLHEQKAYVAEQMRDWSFNDPYLAAVNREQAEEICPTFHRQFPQHERNVRNTIFRAFEAVQDAISGVRADMERAKLEQARVAKAEVAPTYTLPEEDMPPTYGKRPPEDRLAEVLRNRCDDNFDDDTDNDDQPTPVAHHKEKYTQTLFSFMQHTKS